MKNCEENVMKYLPKRYRKYIVWAEKCHNSCDNSNVYFVTIEVNGKEYESENADTIDEMRWNFKETIKEAEKDQNITL